MKLSELAEHEVLHTARLMMEFWETHVAGHHVVHASPELRADAERIGQAMVGFHQSCQRLLVGGAVHPEIAAFRPQEA